MIYETPILAYHDIGSPRQYPGGDRSPAVLPENFAWQMEYLSRHRYEVITLEESLYNETRRPHRQVILTFDDGFDNFYTEAYSILRHYGFPATVFVITDCINQPGWLSLDQIKEIARHGITIGSHTKNHSYLPSLSEEEIKNQIIGSKRLLEDMLHMPVDFISYPNGGFTPLVQTIVRRAGYSAGFTTNRSLGLRPDRFALRRIKMTNHSSKPWIMQAKLSGYYSWLKRQPVAAQERLLN